MTRSPSARERGSAMVMALFVLFLLASTGTALLFLANSEVRMSQASVRNAEVFYIAEGAIETGRTVFYEANVLDEFDDDLDAAAGADTAISVDPDQIEPIFDADGNLTGLTGVGDDVPLVPIQAVSGGFIAAYLMNDPAETGGRQDKHDSNERVIIVGVGAGPDRSFEVVEAVIERRVPIPLTPPSTITLLGQPPNFLAANSKVKDYLGEDCGGASGTGLYLPIVGAIGNGGVTQAEAGWETNPDWISGTYTDLDTFADLTDPTEPTVATGVGTIDPAWNDCANLQAMLDNLRETADLVCTSSYCDFPDYGPDTLIFIDGDYNVGPTQSGQGILVCTGELTLSGRTSWSGMIMVVGEGIYRINGSGNGVISGAMMLADVAGPDETYGTADDCQTGSVGLGQTTFDENGGGNAETVYCSTDLTNTNVRPYEVVEFLQH